jgi:uncharacterized protein (TIRG00374 family)
VAISIAALWWVLADVHWAEVRAHIAEARLLPLILTIVVATATFPLRLIRWRLLLRREDGDPLPVMPLWHAVAIGFMANNILPFRMGEVMRSLTASRLTPVRFTAAFSSVAVERVFDGLTVVAMLVFSLLAAGLPAGVEVAGVPVARTATVAAIAMGAALLVAIVVVAFPALAERVIVAVLPSQPLAARLVHIIEGFRHGLSVLRSPGRIAAVAVLSVVLWLVNALSFYLCFKAFGIPASFAAALLLQGILVFGIAVPTTPGYVGVFEGAIKAVLLVLGVGAGHAVAYALTYHVTTFVPIVLLGAWSLFRTSLSLDQIREAPSA